MFRPNALVTAQQRHARRQELNALEEAEKGLVDEFAEALERAETPKAFWSVYADIWSAMLDRGVARLGQIPGVRARLVARMREIEGVLGEGVDQHFLGVYGDLVADLKTLEEFTDLRDAIKKDLRDHGLALHAVPKIRRALVDARHRILGLTAEKADADNSD